MADSGNIAVELEKVLAALYDARIPFGIQPEPLDGGITAWIDCGDRIEIATFPGHLEGGDLVRTDIASWLIETSTRLDPEWRQEQRSCRERRCGGTIPLLVALGANGTSGV